MHEASANAEAAEAAEDAGLRNVEGGEARRSEEEKASQCAAGCRGSEAAEPAQASGTADAEVQTEDLPDSNQLLGRHQARAIFAFRGRWGVHIFLSFFVKNQKGSRMFVVPNVFEYP